MRSDSLGDTGNPGARAFQLIREAGAEPSPQNYELFYLYASGANEALERELEAELDHGRPVPQTELDRLYDAHVANERFCDAFASLGTRLSEQVHSASDLVREALDSNSKYGCTLEEANERLASLGDKADVTALLAEILHATAQIGGASRQFSARLAAASSKIETLQSEVDDLRQDLQIDPLTGIGNRKHFETNLAMEMARSVRCDQPLCLMMVDIDHFKQFNDTYGHRTGDSALRLVARMLKSNVRDCDTVARYGGEELAVILSNCDIKTATNVAERYRAALAAKEFVRRSTGQKLGQILVSIGIADFRADDTEDALVERADRALYKAKNTGRNRVIVYSGDDHKKIGESALPDLDLRSAQNDKAGPMEDGAPAGGDGLRRAALR